MFVHLHNFSPSETKLKKSTYGGEHGENFDEASVIEKSKEGIVVAVFSGFASGSFKGN
jgi:hypothetical protein